MGRIVEKDSTATVAGHYFASSFNFIPFLRTEQNVACRTALLASLCQSGFSRLQYAIVKSQEIVIYS